MARTVFRWLSCSPNSKRHRERSAIAACAGCLLLAAILPGCTAFEEVFGGRKQERKPVYVEDLPAEDEADTSPGVYRNTHRRHFVAKVLDEGETLVLDDGSVWQVRPDDLIYSIGWEHHHDIVVQDMGAAPRYRLVNRTQREQVLADYLGTPREM